MDGSTIIQFLSDKEGCPGFQFPGTAEGLAAMISYAKVVLGAMSTERFVEILAELGLPQPVIDRLAIAAIQCALGS